ncbi:DUF4198 domain-containing protein [Alteromonas sp. ASW11-130]|uniref:DUF4198 domain-containing protein n=1 Tax=Alteromonas sp. ASW11-130 TaxID=3015775 RepID=UPI002241B4A8|nr:DUF4198 domain-containing protein [Alteromonas sp. ASW11-130]MCW8092213.1 DUF4198 domain-containing protein [Alteromonas sp. ASW11-130]
MRFRNRFVLGSLLISLTSHVMPHDFWLEPGQYYYDKPSSVPIQFKIGHKHNTDSWNLRWDKIVALRNYTPKGVVDMAASIVPKSTSSSGVAKTQKLRSGTYIIGFESYHSVSELKADKFNVYAQEEGLHDILKYRESNGVTKSSGVELYSRKAITIIQVGNELSANVMTPVGHTLEIVPLRHPYDLPADGALAAKVLFKGKPLQHALVEAAPLAGAGHNTQTMRTNSHGRVMFNFTDKGPVLLNVIWGVPLINNNQADFETYFASLTFTVNHLSD